MFCRVQNLDYFKRQFHDLAAFDNKVKEYFFKTQWKNSHFWEFRELLTPKIKLVQLLSSEKYNATVYVLFVSWNY